MDPGSGGGSEREHLLPSHCRTGQPGPQAISLFYLNLKFEFPEVWQRSSQMKEETWKSGDKDVEGWGRKTSEQQFWGQLFPIPCN